MKATVKAFNEEEAKLIIKDKIIFYKVKNKDDFDGLADSFDDILKILGINKK